MEILIKPKIRKLKNRLIKLNPNIVKIKIFVLMV